jgi:hypothetical protein
LICIYCDPRASIADGGCGDTLLAAFVVTQHFVFTMPHTTSDDDNDFKHIRVRRLHPTFGAEVHGVDFSKPVPEDVFSEIYKAITKVSIIRYFLSFSIVRQQITHPFHALHVSTPVRLSLGTHQSLSGI